MAKVFLVAGLGFGDEGKGTISEYLTVREKAHTVVRYNGGAQAAHNVVLSDGRHHTFSQFGSGTFNGARTHLSRFMVVDPAALFTEGAHLQELGVSEVYDWLTIEKNALLITPYQRAANRLRECLRGVHKHGSCGVGVGETRSDFLTHGDAVLTALDLSSKAALREKLSFIRNLKLTEFRNSELDPKSLNVVAAFRMLTTPVNEVVDQWADYAKRLTIVPEDYLSEVIAADKTMVFEGAQGVLLDQDWGFQPHTTWTDITFQNADELLNAAGFPLEDATRIGVIRTYLTRHGYGPLPTEDLSLEVIEYHNTQHSWQGRFRTGHFDTVLLRYALEIIGRVDQLAITHFDVMPHLSRMAMSYQLNQPSDATVKYHFMEDQTKIRVRKPFDMKYQHQLREALSAKFLTVNYWPMNENFVDILQTLLGIKVGILSNGPLVEDKITVV